jgi:hypothetical protein
MELEDFGHSRHAEDVNTALSAKLQVCGYPSNASEAGGDNAKEGKNRQPSEGERAIQLVKASTETPEQSLDQKIKDRFGAEVFDHLKDWDWLIENRKKLEDGFKKADNEDAWAMAQRMKQLSMVDGKPLIYLSKHDGPTHGSWIPKRYDIYLRRGTFRSDNYIGQLYH